MSTKGSTATPDDDHSFLIPIADQLENRQTFEIDIKPLIKGGSSTRIPGCFSNCRILHSQREGKFYSNEEYILNFNVITGQCFPYTMAELEKIQKAKIATLGSVGKRSHVL